MNPQHKLLTIDGGGIRGVLALGMSVEEIMSFYQNVGPKMFDNRWYMKLKAALSQQSAYDATPLANALKEVFGEKTTLEPGQLKTLFLAVTRNQTTDSPWPISSNPAAKYNDPKRPDSNLKIPLWQIVRASTAAPLAFRPERINWHANDPSKSFIFVDGGVTPYNNPAWLLYRMATEERLGFCVELFPRDLLARPTDAAIRDAREP